MNSASGALPQRLRASVTWQGLYAAGVFALLCFAPGLATWLPQVLK